MPISYMPCVSISCDNCGFGYDECHTSPKLEMENLKKQGWTGTYKKCFCPKCSQRIEKRKCDEMPILQKG